MRNTTICLAGLSVALLLAGCGNPEGGETVELKPPPPKTQEDIDKIKNNPNIPDNVKKNILARMQTGAAQGAASGKSSAEVSRKAEDAAKKK